ncbi:MAG: LuxR C-terminal-related transcriptional regulator [Bryobacteraceae bacterium]
MNPTSTKITVSVCDTQPVTILGVQTALQSAHDLQFASAFQSLSTATGSGMPPAVMLVDKAFGVQPITDLITRSREFGIETAVVVWGSAMSESDALRFLKIGARGILRKTAEVPSVLACIRAVGSGSTWMEDCLFREAARCERTGGSELTPRERQVLELVEQGLKNKEIARELGIRPGTVKIHLKHIFEKTGVRGRYGLALTGLKDKGMVSMLAV